MRKIRSFASQSPAIVISQIPQTFSLGSGAGYAASTVTSHPAATKISWHNLSLRNGWHAAAKGYDTGTPAYTVSNGIVYLTGALSRANQSATLGLVGVLPKSARPKHLLEFTGYNYAAAGETSIAVYPNGNVDVYGNGGDENYFSSLAGIEFPLGS
jgi:hypothetical protein